MRRVPLILTIAVTALLGSCGRGKVYDHYEHTPLAGWDRVDELTYNVPTLQDAGRYVTTLGLRINDTYPFQSLSLIVEQDVYDGRQQKSKKKKPALLKSYTDTINCTLFDKKGTEEGNGISYFQYHYRISEQELAAGDSLHVTVRHAMRREIMPGISDVGISISKMK